MKRKVLDGSQWIQYAMSLPPNQFLNRLAVLAEPSFLCEVLAITSEDIIERFGELIEDNEEELREIFDIDLSDMMIPTGEEE